MDHPPPMVGPPLMTRTPLVVGPLVVCAVIAHCSADGWSFGHWILGLCIFFSVTSIHYVDKLLSEVG